MNPHAITPSQPSEAVERQDAPHGNPMPVLLFCAVLGALVTALLVVYFTGADPLKSVTLQLAVPLHPDCLTSRLC